MLTTEQCEGAILVGLQAVQAHYARALNDTSPEGNVLVALGTKLRVDQVRRIVASSSVPDEWTERDGKRCISTTTMLSRDYLARYVGRERFMPIDSVMIFLGDLARGSSRYAAPEMTAATFVNLMAVEPYHNPRAELPIWLTLAHLLASGRTEDNLHREIPGLLTEYDILHVEIPNGVPMGDKLRPGASRAPAETWSQFEMRLLAAVRPDLANTIAALATEGERTALFQAQEAELRAYIRTHVFERVARALAEEPPSR